MLLAALPHPPQCDPLDQYLSPQLRHSLTVWSWCSSAGSGRDDTGERVGSRRGRPSLHRRPQYRWCDRVCLKMTPQCSHGSVCVGAILRRLKPRNSCSSRGLSCPSSRTRSPRSRAPSRSLRPCAVPFERGLSISRITVWTAWAREASCLAAKPSPYSHRVTSQHNPPGVGGWNSWFAFPCAVASAAVLICPWPKSITIRR